MTKGGLWRDANQEVEDVSMESVLLFRSHHALGTCTVKRETRLMNYDSWLHTCTNKS